MSMEKPVPEFPLDEHRGLPALGDGHHHLLTPEQVAQYLQVKLPRVYEAVRAHRLRAIRVGRLLRFRPEDVERFEERNSTGRR
jgi:excisionase family DNA binding protein